MLLELLLVLLENLGNTVEKILLEKILLVLMSALRLAQQRMRG